MLVAKQQRMDIIMLPSNGGSVVTCTDFCASSCLICRRNADGFCGLLSAPGTVRGRKSAVEQGGQRVKSMFLRDELPDHPRLQTEFFVTHPFLGFSFQLMCSCKLAFESGETELYKCE